MNDTLATPNGEVTVLVVEDSLTQALKLQHLLEQHQLKVIIASNGKEALLKLAASIPTLVVTDINMPEMDGYELCQRIKQDAQSKELPVILLTSLSDPEDILKGLECGADNFIVKPYDEDFLLSRIRHVMENLELRKQARRRGAERDFLCRPQVQAHRRPDSLDRSPSLDLRDRRSQEPRTHPGQGEARNAGGTAPGNERADDRGTRDGARPPERVPPAGLSRIPGGCGGREKHASVFPTATMPRRSLAVTSSTSCSSRIPWPGSSFAT